MKLKLNKLNKLLFVLFVISFVFIAVPAKALADDNSSNNQSTQNETNETDNRSALTDVSTQDVVLGNTNHGMEIRLLQLEKSLTTNIDHGTAIVNEIEKQNLSVSTDALQNILDDANTLNGQIKSMLAQTPVNVSTEKFVALKSQAINLTFQFRKELYNTLTPDQLNTIRKNLRDDFTKNSTRVKEIDSEIKGKIKSFDQEQALNMYNKFGLNDTALKAKIESGNFTVNELRKELTKDFNDMKKAQRQKMQEQIKAETDKFQKDKMMLSARNMNLNKTDVENILNDTTLTWNEKASKIRILAQDRKQANQANWMNNSNRNNRLNESNRGGMMDNSTRGERGVNPKMGQPGMPGLGNRNRGE